MLAIELCKNSITFDMRSIKTCHYYFFNSSVKHWLILIIFGMQLDANVCSFGHLALRLSLHYLVKRRSRILTIGHNEFILGSACVSSENYWDHKIIENLLLHFLFKNFKSTNWNDTSTASGPLESWSYWTCCWQMVSTSTVCVCAAGGHFEHMLKWKWCDVTRVLFVW